MNLCPNQAAQVYAAYNATRGKLAQWYGEISEDLKVSVSRTGAVSVNVPGCAERHKSIADFAAAYGIRPQLPPLRCPIEKALWEARGSISRMAQRQPSVIYDHSTLWAAFEAATAELKRLKNV